MIFQSELSFGATVIDCIKLCILFFLMGLKDFLLLNIQFQFNPRLSRYVLCRGYGA